MYFSAADEPGDSVESIESEYVYIDPINNGTAGNHFEGYKIKKSDIKVTGTDRNGNIKDITEFKYSPDVLKQGKNEIEIEYTIAEGITVKDTIYVNGDESKLIKLDAQYIGEDVYLGTVLNSEDFIVKGVYENVVEETITEYGISPSELTEGENTVTITMDGLSSAVQINAINEASIIKYETESNDEIKTANKIDLNINYTGNMNDDNDVDTYKLKLTEKSKVSISFTHQKTDSVYSFWKVSLLNDSEGEVMKVYSVGENANIQSDSVRLPAGNYYIRITPDAFSDMNYTFCVNSLIEGIETENEDNGDYDKATPVSVGSSITGNIQSEQDTDFYKFELPQGSTLNVAFTHALIDSYNSFWSVELMSDNTSGTIKNDDKHSVTYIQGNAAETITTTWSDLPADTYYLKVKKDYYNNSDYTITLY